jgi:DDE superfamily endonuclease
MSYLCEMITKKEYTEYLISTRCNYTCSNLAEHRANTSHDAVSNFLKREKITPRSVWNMVKNHIRDGPDSFLIVDDSVQDKQYSKFIELVKKQYSGNVHGLVRGIGVVNMVHSNGAERDFYPIDFRIYAPDNDKKTKNEHFREMFITANADKCLKCRKILFDSWYAGADNLKLIHRLGWTFFTTLKSNRLVSLSKESGYVSLQSIEWSADQLCEGVIVKLHKVPFQVRLFKIVATNGDIEWLITNELDLKDVEVVKQNNDPRWQIEDLHRGVKQLTGSEKCQCRSARAQRNHIACSIFAWITLTIEAKKQNTTIYQVHKDIFKPFLKQQIVNPTVPVHF